MSSPASPQGLAQRLPSICCSPEGAGGCRVGLRRQCAAGQPTRRSPAAAARHPPPAAGRLPSRSTHRRQRHPAPAPTDGAGPAALRTLSLAKDEFAELERAAGAGTKPSLWRVSLSVRAGGADAPRYRSVSGQEEHTAGGGARSPEVAVQLGSLPTPPRPPP